MKTWTVIRHSGRAKAEARVAFAGVEERARSFYQTRAKELKQGSILLMDHAGGIQEFHWSPR